MITIKNVDSSELKEALELALKLEIECEMFVGTLIDNYILHDAEKLVMNGQRTKYIIAMECYKNMYSSNYTILMTNDSEKMEEYQQLFEENSVDE